MPSPEHAPRPEQNTEKLKDLERAPEILDVPESSVEESPEEVEKHIERARTEAQHEALASRETGKHEKESHSSSPQPHTPHLSREESFKHTMRDVRAELSTPEKSFSKFVHNPAVERASDAIGKTVARPDAILSGSVSACIFVLSLYIMARFYGFELRGSETILAFLAGWVVGILFDLIRGFIKRKRS